MPQHKRFHLKDLDLLRAELAALGLTLPIDEDLSVLGDRVRIGRHETPNRFVVQPMEGFDSTADGTPGPLSFRRYAHYAAGGSGLLWFEATAVLHEARSNPHQLCLYKDNVNVYARLVDNTRRIAREAFGHEILMVVQLTHSGRYSKPTGIPRPIIAHHSAVLDPKHNLAPDYPLVTDDYLDRLQDVYVEAAKLAAQAGFDGVDLKSCHRYLVSELLASFTREGKYGGSLENRSRMLRETLQRIAREVPAVFVTTRMNVYDAIPYPYGFGVNRDDHRTPDLSEPLEVIRHLRAVGIPLINLTIGNPYYQPHYGRPFDRPVAGVPLPDEHPLAGVARFVEITRAVQQAMPDLPVIASGYSWLRHLMPYVAAGVIRRGGATLVGQGRGAFAYPDSVKDILTKGRMNPAKACITCSGCSQIMRDGTMTGCVVRDSEIYGPQYKLGRRFAMDRLLAEAKRCQDCEFPTCSAGCPAGIDVPAFLRAFANGDIPKAYEVLRRSNVLPEMCACVCPSEVQCEGGCVERIFAECALPIRDIQLVVSQIARREEITGVRLPEKASGRRVAVVGGGPAGVACAVRLLEKGHSVTLFEKSDRLGGTPDAIIPETRYDDASQEIDAILAPARASGRIEIRFHSALGGGKRGQPPFAGTARRVLRTNGDCPNPVRHEICARAKPRVSGIAPWHAARIISGMAGKKREKVGEKDLTGLKYFDRLAPLLSRLHDVGCARDKAGNRKLHFDQYSLLVLLYLFNPVVTSLRSLQQASELANVQKRLGCPRAALGSLSEAGSVFDSDRLPEIIAELGAELAPLGRDARLKDIQQTLTLVDGTLIAALPKLMEASWRKATTGSGLVKWRLHTHFEVDRHVPTRIEVTPDGGGEHDERAVLERTIESDRLYVTDRGYAKFSLFNRIVAAKSSYVCRLRDNSVYEVLEERPLSAADRAAGVLSDQLVRFTNGKSAARPDHPIRLVRIACNPHTSRGKYRGGSTGVDSDGVLRIATNLLDPPAEILGLIYRFRWTIEIFFRFFKHVLGCRHLLSHDPNGIEIQTYCAIIACLLISLVTGRKPTLRTYEMICFYFCGLANEEELLTHIAKLQKHDG